MFDLLSDEELERRAREARWAARDLPVNSVEHQEALAYAEALEAELALRERAAAG
jgi:hypothetical protein